MQMKGCSGTSHSVLSVKSTTSASAFGAEQLKNLLNTMKKIVLIEI